MIGKMVKLRSSERKEGTCTKSKSKLAALSERRSWLLVAYWIWTLYSILTGARTLSFAWFIGGNIAPLSDTPNDISLSRCPTLGFIILQRGNEWTSVELGGGGLEGGV